MWIAQGSLNIKYSLKEFIVLLHVSYGICRFSSVRIIITQAPEHFNDNENKDENIGRKLQLSIGYDN